MDREEALGLLRKHHDAPPKAADADNLRTNLRPKRCVKIEHPIDVISAMYALLGRGMKMPSSRMMPSSN